MAEPSKRAVAKKVVETHGRTFCEELHIPVERNTPAPLFRALCLSVLASARIGHEAALEATRGLADAGWTTPERMADSTWRERTDVLNHSGYARYDESTSRMLGDSTRHRGDNAAALRSLSNGRRDYARLVAGLVRTELEDDYETLRQAQAL